MSLGFFRGNKTELVNYAMRTAGIMPTLPDNRRSPPEPSHDDAMRPPPKPLLDGGAALALALDEAGVLTPAQNAVMSAEALGITTFDVGPQKMSRDEATGKGFTGNQCNICGSMEMQIAGHCEVCRSCGSTTGCS